jgi:hypothetical protein
MRGYSPVYLVRCNSDSSLFRVLQDQASGSSQIRSKEDQDLAESKENHESRSLNCNFAASQPSTAPPDLPRLRSSCKRALLMILNYMEKEKRERMATGSQTKMKGKRSKRVSIPLVKEQEASYQVKNIPDILSRGVKESFFPRHLELVPQLNEVYELELAYYESKILTDEEIIRNGPTSRS